MFKLLIIIKYIVSLGMGENKVPDADKASWELKNELNDLREETKSLKVEIESIREQLTKETAFRKKLKKEMAKELKNKESLIDLSNKLLLPMSPDEISSLILERSIFNSVSDTLIIFDLDGNIVEVNTQACKMHNYSYDELIKLHGKDIVHPSSHNLFDQFIKNTKITGSFSAEAVDIYRDGTPIFVEVKGRMFDYKGKKHLLAVIRDITSQKRVEEQLKKSNEINTNILERITDCFFALDSMWRFTYINKEVEQLWGINREEFIGKVIWDKFPKTVGTPFYNEYVKAILQQKAVCFEALSPIINTWVEVHAYPSQDGLSVYFHDINERKIAEEKLRLLEERFSKAFNFSPNPMCIRTLKDFKYIDVNDSWLKCIGYSREEVIDHTATEIGLPAFLKDGTNIAMLIREKGSVHNLELDFSTKLGNKRTGLMSAEIIDIEGEKCVLSVVQDITERKLAEKTLQREQQRLYSLLDGFPGLVSIIAPDFTVRFANRNYRETFGENQNRRCYEINCGRQEPCDVCYTKLVFEYQQPNYWELPLANGQVLGVHEYPFIDIDGSPLVIKLHLDITERKRMEEELSRLSRLNLIGEMAAGIAHEIRNPMTTVRGFLQMLGGKSDFANYKEYHDLMIAELDRANSIITEFLSLAKSKANNLKMQNLNLIIEAILPLINADAMNSDKYIEVELGDIPNLLLNDKEMRQLLLNLVRNGLESMPPGKCLRIKTFVDGEQVVLSVQDQGQGIEPKILEKLGTPFFTTKDDGTGLGLAICYSIADRHNATVNVETDSRGTTFYARFKSKIN